MNPLSTALSSDKTFKESVQTHAAKIALNYLEKDPTANIPKLLNWVDAFDRQDVLKPHRKAVHNALDNPDGNWYRLIMSLWTDIDPNVRQTVFENLIINASIFGYPRQQAMAEKHECNVPWAILMDPTSACNLQCVGCWAAEYGNKLHMSYETLDDIITQGKALGTYMYIYSGGEPLMRKKDIIRLCEAHPDCMFLAFTNGTLIDEEFADEMLRVGNFAPAISVEGFEAETDARRGKGTYAAVMNAMEILKRKKLLFGASCCYTSANVDTIGGEAFVDHLIAAGSKFAWFFTYMPVGVDAVPELIASADQRAFMYDRIRTYRETKPLFTMDFWNDGEFVGGCIAGGRIYCHINSNGDVEPCAFIHYSDSNVKNKTLLESYQSPLFMGYRNGQSFNDNHLRPCPLLDNCGALSKIVDESNAYSTDLQNPEDVHSLSAKCTDAAEGWQPVADELWDERERRKAAERLAESA